MPLSSRLGLLVAVAASGVLLSPPAGASLPPQPPRSERVEPTRAQRGGTIQLAAKKKKKKKASGKRPAAGAPAESDSDSADTDSSGAAGKGASDDELQKAARVAPKSDSDSGDEGAAKATSKKTARAEDESAGGSGLEGPTPRYLDFAIGGQAFLRSLTYNQYRQGDVREYQRNLLGGLVASVDWYPGAHFTRGFATNIGLDLNITQAFGVSSKALDGTMFPTQVHDYNGGVKLRIPLEGLEPSLTVGYGDHLFQVNGAGRPPLPNVEYKYVRAVVGLRMTLPNHLSLTVGGGYRHILSPGDIKTTFFPHLAVKGMEANVGVGYAINHTIEARAGVDLRRYGYTMHSTNNDMYIVGGAIDQTIAFSLSLAVMLGGPEQPHRAASDETPAAASDGDSRGDGETSPAKRTRARRPKAEGEGATGME